MNNSYLILLIFLLIMASLCVASFTLVITECNTCKNNFSRIRPKLEKQEDEIQDVNLTGQDKNPETMDSDNYI